MKRHLYFTLIMILFFIVDGKKMKASTKWTFYPLFDEESSQTLGYKKNGDLQEINTWEIFYNGIEGIKVETKLDLFFSNVTTTNGEIVAIPTWSSEGECKRDCEEFFRKILYLNTTNIVEWKCENTSEDFSQLFNLKSKDFLNCYVKRSDDKRSQWRGKYTEKEMVVSDMLTISHSFYVLSSFVDPSNTQSATMDFIQPKVRSIFHSSRDCSVFCAVFKMKCLNLIKLDSREIYLC
jgi:hypothetical protein